MTASLTHVKGLARGSMFALACYVAMGRSYAFIALRAATLSIVNGIDCSTK